MGINLVLSGGGARGLAHLGIIKVLLEEGITINKISGVSSGAVIGAFISAGYKPEEVLKIFIENKLLYKLRPVFNAGIFRITKWQKILSDAFPRNSFEDLKIPLIINATDINECKNVYFSKGDLVAPLLASCSVPGIFEPIVINGHQFVDGGVLNILPVEPFLNDAEKIIASHVNPLGFEMHIHSSLRMLERSIFLSKQEQINEKKKLVHFFLEPNELARFQLFSLDHAKEIFEIGYQYASLRRTELKVMQL
jgi:NTE family protein